VFEKKIGAKVKNSLRKTIRIDFYCNFAALNLSRNRDIRY
jgi:hypothetical protein